MSSSRTGEYCTVRLLVNQTEDFRELLLLGPSLAIRPLIKQLQMERIVQYRLLVNESQQSTYTLNNKITAKGLIGLPA